MLSCFNSKQIQFLIVVMVLVLWLPVPLLAGPYPKINLATGYKVDPDWPKKPDHIKWRYMTGVAVDSQDRVWTLNAINPMVQVYDTEGNLLKSWGEGMFKNPHYIRIGPEGHVWAADFGNHTVRKFTEEGKLLLTLGTMDMPGRDEDHLNRPTDVAITPDGDIFVTDGYGNNRIVHYDKEGKFIKGAGKSGVGPGMLSQPHSIAIDSKGLLYVCERNNARIQIFDQDGKSIAQWRDLINPWGIWITPEDEIYVCGSSPARWTEKWGNLGNPPHDQIMIRFDIDGKALQLWSFPITQDGNWEPGQTDWLHGIAVDSHGDLYIGDVADNSPTHRAQKFIRLPAEQ